MIKINNETAKGINNVNYYDQERFISDAKRYIKAIKQGRMICSIGSVSNSGMSRTIKFLSPEYNKTRKNWQYWNFFAFFKALNYSPVKDSDYFRIGGCGMDMIFHTNYTIIRRLYNMGFMSKKDRDILSQMTPTVI